MIWSTSCDDSRPSPPRAAQKPQRKDEKMISQAASTQRTLQLLVPFANSLPSVILARPSQVSRQTAVGFQTSLPKRYIECLTHQFFSSPRQSLRGNLFPPPPPLNSSHRVSHRGNPSDRVFHVFAGFYQALPTSAAPIVSYTPSLTLPRPRFSPQCLKHERIFLHALTDATDAPRDRARILPV